MLQNVYSEANKIYKKMDLDNLPFSEAVISLIETDLSVTLNASYVTKQLLDHYSKFTNMEQ